MSKFNYPHLPIYKLDLHEERYKPNSGYDRSKEVNNKSHSTSIKQGLETTINKINSSLDPNLIFKVQLKDQLSEKDIDSLDLRLLSDTSSEAYIVFSDDIEVSTFKDKLKKYSEWEDSDDQKKPSYNGIFSNIKNILPLEPSDRIGYRLSKIDINDSASYWVDIELWHRGKKSFCSEDEEIIDNIIYNQGRITDRFVNNDMHILRAELNGKILKVLLEQAIVCEIELPPELQSIGRKYIGRALEDLSIVPASENAPLICVIDSGISPKHALIKDNLVEYKTFREDMPDGLDENGHGTFIAGLALYGDIEKCIETNIFQANAKLVSSKVLDEKGKLGPSEKLYINQIIDSINYYHSNFKCRIFNLSIGSDNNIISNLKYQSRWASAIDSIIYEKDIIITISAGNIDFEEFGLSDEEILNEFPKYLFYNQNRLIDPSFSNLGITVGSIANTARISKPKKYGGKTPSSMDNMRQVATLDQPSPFTRLGLGYNKAIKPDFVTYGGNLVYDELFKKINHTDVRNGIISTNFEHNDNLFTTDIGTSVSAPQIANMCAQILNEYPGMKSDTVKVLLATSASYTESMHSMIEDYRNNKTNDVIKLINDRIDDIDDEESKNILEEILKNNIIKLNDKKRLLRKKELPLDIRDELLRTPAFTSSNSNETDLFLKKVFGYGKPSVERAIYSSDNIVTLVKESTIKLGEYNVFELPRPKEFIEASTPKSISIIISFSPPTKHTRKDYCGYNIEFELLRGLNEKEIVKICGNEIKEKTYSKLGSKRVTSKLCPKKSFLKNSCLKSGRFTIKGSLNNDYGDKYYLVINSIDNWASSFVDDSFDEDAIPYSLAVSYEVKDDIELYSTIKQMIRVESETVLEQEVGV